MPNSLLTGVSGLLAHQRMLDVTGNNLANLSTTGYKAQRVLFSDLVYQTLRPASDGQASGIGGTNPSQVGSGSIASQISRNFNQSSLEQTGGQFDMALDGDGFFVLDNGTNNVLTRAGTFTVDRNQMLVDASTGFFVNRVGTVGEPVGDTPGFQIPGDDSIRIPIGSTVLGSATEEIQIAGNLSADSDGPQAAIVQASAPFLAGGLPALAATLLSALDDSGSAYAVGDFIEIEGSDLDGTAISNSFAVDAATTVGDLIAAIDSAFAGATASLAADGRFQLQAATEGETPLSLSLANATGNTGAIDFDSHLFVTTTPGSDGDVVNAPVEFFDSIGRAHVLQVRFERQPLDQTWDVVASIDSPGASLNTTNLGQVTFNADGSFQQIANSALGYIPVSIDFGGSAEAQTVNLQLAPENGFQGLTQTANSSAARADSDGYPAGTLYTASVSQDGMIIGLGTNGREVQLAQLSIAQVANNSGLSAVGDNHFETTVNSGPMQLSTATSGGRGRVVSGQLESSNVDLAYEFTRLIVAQRGFSANARTITVADEILDEVTNIIR